MVGHVPCFCRVSVVHVWLTLGICRPHIRENLIQSLDINECALGGCPNAECTNSAGSFICGACYPDNYRFGNLVGCAPCPPSRYLFGGSCILCPANKYSNGTNSVSCDTCPFPSVVNGDQTGCTCPVTPATDDPSGVCECSLGYENIQGSICQPCPVGEYGVPGGNCAVCPHYATTASTASPSLSDCFCASGYLFNITAGECVRVCGPGEHVEAGDCVVSWLYCIVCSFAYCDLLLAFIVCLLLLLIPQTSVLLPMQDCPIGSYKNETSTAKACFTCPVVGAITPSVRALTDAECTCPTGKWPEFVGAVETCVNYCEPGFSRPELNQCEVRWGSLVLVSMRVYACASVH